MSDSGAQQRMSLEHWMRDLPPPIKDVPFVYLAIPGSHDSMTYRITRSSGLAPDAEPILHRLYPVFRGTIIRWTITQALDTWGQLKNGIRYLDLRLATKPGEESFYFTHGLYAGEISEPLHQVREFVDSHPGEVVILDFQHFYAFELEHHQKLMRFLINTFQRRLVPRTLDPTSVTLNSLARLGQQIIIIYRHQSVYSAGEFWQPQTMPSPWPRQDKPEGLLRYLESVKRHPGTGFVHQAVLTPTPTFIVLRWTSNLRDKCALPVKNQVLPKLLADFSPGPPLIDSVTSRSPVNVVIADFIDMDDSKFPKTIIQLNMKLLNTAYANYG